MTDDRARHLAQMLDALAEEVATRGAEGWLVGGCLRNALLGLDVADVDVALTTPPREIARTVRRRFALGMAALARDTYRLVMRERGERGPVIQLDLSPLHGATVVEDLAQRDFRVNALALPLAAYRQLFDMPARRSDADNAPPIPPLDLLDPLGGLADLRAGVLHPAGEEALYHDPGRILRAARLIAAQGFRPSDATRDQARQASRLLPLLPSDRLGEELSWLLALPRCADGLVFLAEVGALGALFPALGAADLSAHAIASIAATADLQADAPAQASPLGALAELAPLRAWLAAPATGGHPRFASLRRTLLLHAGCHGAGRETGAARGRSAAFQRLPDTAREQSNARHAAACIHWRAAFAAGAVTEPALRHFFARYHDDGTSVLVAAAACNAALVVAPLPGVRFSGDITPAIRAVVLTFFAARERLLPPRLLDGAALFYELGMPPGPAIGRILRAVRTAQLDGDITTRDEALALARRLGEADARAEA
jgi:tRNA nucleotidyltransferase/poly(A) polymerase